MDIDVYIYIYIYIGPYIYYPKYFYTIYIYVRI